LGGVSFLFFLFGFFFFFLGCFFPVSRISRIRRLGVHVRIFSFLFFFLASLGCVNSRRPLSSIATGSPIEVLERSYPLSLRPLEFESRVASPAFPLSLAEMNGQSVWSIKAYATGDKLVFRFGKPLPLLPRVRRGILSSFTLSCLRLFGHRRCRRRAKRMVDETYIFSLPVSFSVCRHFFDLEVAFSLVPWGYRVIL